jgi:hypothetical protein
MIFKKRFDGSLGGTIDRWIAFDAGCFLCSAVGSLYRMKFCGRKKLEAFSGAHAYYIRRRGARSALQDVIALLKAR